MFRSNFRTLMNLKTSISRGSPLFANSTLRASILNTLRSFPKRAFSTKGRLFKFSGGGGGSSKLDELIEQLVRRLPNGNVGALLVGINTFFYAVYLMWPRDIMHKFLNNFTISNYNLSRGRFHTLIFSHFAHMGFLSYAIDSLILYLFCQNLMFFPWTKLHSKARITQHGSWISITFASTLIISNEQTVVRKRQYHERFNLYSNLPKPNCIVLPISIPNKHPCMGNCSLAIRPGLPVVEYSFIRRNFSQLFDAQLFEIK